MSGHAFTFGGLSDGNYGGGNLYLQDNAGNPVALSVGNNNQSTTFSGQIDGPRGSSFEKIGSGVLTLGGQISVGRSLSAAARWTWATTPGASNRVP